MLMIYFIFRMADGIDENFGICDEYVDPYCDICFETKGLNVTVYGYCKDCYQFLCSDCHVFHDKFQVTKNHVILQGSSMPQSQADKPPRFPRCDDHPTLVKDQFCCKHKSMVCSSCSSDHRSCIVQSIDCVCERISSSETDSLYDAVKDLQDEARSVKLSLETNIKKLKSQRKSMLKEAQKLYDEIISNINKLYKEMQTDIETNCQSQILLMSQHQEKINAMIGKLDSSLTDIAMLQGKPIDTKVFLKIQENVNDTNQIACKLSSLDGSMLFVNLSIVPAEITKLFLSFSLGSVSKSIKPHTKMVVNDLVFPSATLSPLMKVTKQTMPLSQMNVTKQCNYKTKLKINKRTCIITGMSITEDGRILMADYGNSKVKLFSHELKFLSSVSVPDRPWYMLLSSDPILDGMWL